MILLLANISSLVSWVFWVLQFSLLERLPCFSEHLQQYENINLQAVGLVRILETQTLVLPDWKEQWNKNWTAMWRRRLAKLPKGTRVFNSSSCSLAKSVEAVCTVYLPDEKMFNCNVRQPAAEEMRVCDLNEDDVREMWWAFCVPQMAVMSHN